MAEQITKQKIIDDFLIWTNEKTAEKFSSYQPLGDRVLIRLYYFDARKYNKSKVKLYKDMVSNTDVGDDYKSRLYPIAKVLAVKEGNNLELNKNDLVLVSDLMTGSKINQEWVDYQALLLEKPGMKDRVDEPHMHIGYITQWKDYIFIQDKFSNEMTIEDAYTFLLPERYIIARFEKD